ncbi:SDR family NAD(P)-dependent oxidoreductase [Actinomadura alba]|uniref:Glucose 1-dehydrogenase n=1 Tax=Actinomadura alba TaxID=406431 RepID=A0ABR7LSV5_9ACTN|nr:glucose 1-dehydrogenase [Actinomadura alba]MBC6467545.1 glucose 1-dehydrogenase [Actinomadura alba]
MTEFDGKVVLITGGGSGMGLATARRLLDSGARVVLAGRSAERLKVATEDLDADDRVLAVPADVARTGDLDHLMARTRERFGSLDGVFANAGVAPFARSADMTEADVDHIVDINFKGVFFTVQKSLPLLVDGGSIVLNSSWLVHRGMAFTSIYSASKAAVRNLAQTLAADLAERSIRVNSVSPGYIVTPMFDGIATTEDARQACRSQVALGRLGQPGDIADGVLFLLSPKASYITGQEILIDGGLIRSIPL